MEDLLVEYPVVVECPVIWGDMDAFQHLNNTVYFKYFESARMAFFDKIGFENEKGEIGIGPILASTQCRFRIPLKYPDTVSIGARIVDMEGDRFTMLYRVVSHKHRKVAAEGDGLIIAYDYNASEKSQLPNVICQRINELQEKGL
ncbi:MAG: thioesterase [Moraxellaceae bacterium]|nr:MAG: thioesterase [Moraxellaceae bacterium]